MSEQTSGEFDAGAYRMSLQAEVLRTVPGVWHCAGRHGFASGQLDELKLVELVMQASPGPLPYRRLQNAIDGVGIWIDDVVAEGLASVEDCEAIRDAVHEAATAVELAWSVEADEG